MQDFPANSAKARRQSEGPGPGPRMDQPEKVERVISGEAVRRKRGLSRQFKDTFIEGSARMALEYMATDIVVPAIRDLIYDALQGGLDRMIYGESHIRRGRSSSTTSYSNVGHVNYQGMSSGKPNTSRSLSQKARSRHDFGDIVLASRQDAEDVIDRMFDILSRYGFVELSALYIMVGIQPDHTDQKWGWTSLAGAKAAKQRDGGYLLDLPTPEPLGR